MRGDRHLVAARALGVDISGAGDLTTEAGGILAEGVVAMMKQLEMPNGLSAVGFTEDDIPELVEGTLPQHRVTKLSPRPAERVDLEAMFRDAMTAW